MKLFVSALIAAAAVVSQIQAKQMALAALQDRQVGLMSVLRFEIIRDAKTGMNELSVAGELYSDVKAGQTTSAYRFEIYRRNEIDEASCLIMNGANPVVTGFQDVTTSGSNGFISFEDSVKTTLSFADLVDNNDLKVVRFTHDSQTSCSSVIMQSLESKTRQNAKEKAQKKSASRGSHSEDETKVLPGPPTPPVPVPPAPPGPVQPPTPVDPTQDLPVPGPIPPPAPVDPTQELPYGTLLSKAAAAPAKKKKP